ncbi:hypothetical protein A3860_35980 [Niastella vici]|uniref:Carbohydrate-binding protein SusD n=1 Tax=Niastella vici TaxID=1703345 RepID=A0A1V9FNJ6_9BACT|nr:RagB/SusD family nutrient uptake outer membrane protein [Niastella vici]OQP59913.1 hypothetical protein A3860_35980 [Niastella vici]
MRYNYFIKSYNVLILVISIFCLTACKKYLDLKPNKSQVVPSTLADLQALLDRHDQINEFGPQLLDMVADDYYLTTSAWQSLPDEYDRLNYIWDKDASYLSNWNQTYQHPVYYANVVLDQLAQIDFDESERTNYNNIKGAALYIRAFAFWELAQLYCTGYSSDAANDMGIVLRLSSNIEEKSTRSTVQKTYDQIISDLKAAAELLPESTAFPTRPNKTAAYGALARTYLSMRDYTNASYYADLCLQKYNSLIDFNTLVPVGNPPIAQFNKETIYYNHPGYTPALNNSRAKIDSVLYKLYNTNDLRKTVFFKSNSDGTFGFQGSYASRQGEYMPFDGIATDEMYLIRSECFARAGNKDAALADLNLLIGKRWKNNGSFVPFTAVSASDALNIILMERRKELCFRGVRWSDLRRFNLDGANINLSRMLNGTSYLLPANDTRWTLLIPKEIITITHLPQNVR